MAPFLGVTERSAQVARLIVTNANELADDIKARDGVFSLRGIDFDDLTPEDFTAVANWLRARDAPLAKKTPRDDQLAALTRIAEAHTIQYARAVLRAGLNQALRWNLISRNVAALVEPPRHVPRGIQPLVPEQARRFFVTSKGTGSAPLSPLRRRLGCGAARRSGSSGRT